MSLLSEAKKIDVPQRINEEARATADERIELAFAVLRGEIEMHQARRALVARGYSANGGEGILAGAVWGALRRGELKLSRDR